MSDYVLSCCSTIDLDAQLVKDLDLNTLPFHYFLGDNEYVDDFGQTIPYKEFYKRMVEGEMTRTSQVNAEEYCEYFEKFLQEGKDILHCTLSSGISGTINSCRIAAEMLKEKYPERKIIIIDSLAASSGYGLLMTLLSEEKKAGKTIDELAIFAEDIKLSVVHWFFSTDLTFYIRGGRVSKASGFIGNMLHICPLLDVSVDGKLIPREKIVGKKKVVYKIVDKMKESAKNGFDYDGKVYICHSDSEADANKVAELVKEAFPKVEEVKLFSIGTTIGAHTGPGTVALFYIGNKRYN